MPKSRKLSAEALALLYLRSERGWSKKELASHHGYADDKQISRYETGEKTLHRDHLEALAAPLGHPPEALDALVFIHRLIAPEDPQEPASPVVVTPAERRRIDRAALAAGWAMADAVRDELRRRKRAEKAAADRREAQELWERMRSATRQERRDLVAVFPEFRSWALAEKVCHESERAAAHRAEDALDLADLALFIARRMPGEESWRSRLEGYCWAYTANARRVANDFAKADKAFARAWEFWRAGASTTPELLAEWRLLDLEASLRRAQHRFSEALELLDRARAASEGDPMAAARILLKKEQVFEQMGDIQGALEALAESAPFIEGSGDSRLLFAFHFKTTNHLWHLERYKEAADQLPHVRELAERQGAELDLLRVVWLEAKVAAGQGRKKEALVGLELVRSEFTARALPYDAALAALDLAVLWLEEGRAAEVRELALAMAWIFQAQGIAREALAALALFRDAALGETATVELVRRTIAELERARRSAPPPRDGRRGRE
ncbi:MAG TPA: hypothetical protein VGG03_00695 [Thermoanaerobaculia bacterium]|jgi:transcriptional regulator with XRE-family HTH domain